MYWSNVTLQTSEYTITDEKIPDSFSGFRIAQVSDLHDAQFGENNIDLLNAIKAAQPDIIALTGDLVDSRRLNIDLALDFSRQAAKIAPTYYITGNHEARVSEYGVLKAGLIEAGVTVLENESVDIEIENEKITLLGIQDIAFEDWYYYAAFEDVVRALPKSGNYTVMLAHRPHFLRYYSEYGADLVLSGHSHGGQFRLPFIGGVFAPGQRFFPEYDAGFYEMDGTQMIISRGIGNSVIPVRFNNRPELVIVELKSELK